MSTQHFPKIAVAAAVIALWAGHADAATLVASYGFNGTLASSVTGAPSLVAVDPTSTAAYVTDTVRGVSRTVYQIGGVNSPLLSQGGLTLDTTGVISAANGYSVELTLEFLGRDNAWRRILDTLDRQSDAGFYADPSNQLDVYPVGGSAAGILAGAYRNIVLTVGPSGPNNVTAYIDGGTSLNLTTDVLNIGSSGIIGLFLDNVAGGGQGEWSNANIATANFFEGVLTAEEAAAFKGDAYVPPIGGGGSVGGVPEPATWALMLIGFGGIGASLRRRRGIGAIA